MMNVSACLFDLDGVIVNTAEYHFDAWRMLADELGFSFTREDNERLKGVSRMRSLDILLEIGGITLSDERKTALAEKKNANYRKAILQMTQDEVLPGAREFIEEIRNAGWKTALGSASKNAPTILQQVGMSHLFDALIDGNKVSHAKPDPEVFLTGAKELGVAPEQCIVFEDAQAGVEAALNAHMHVIGIGSPKILAKAHKVVDGLHELSMQKLKNWLEL